VSGDFNGRAIETLQPPKYAAMEGVLQSGYGLPLYIGGIVDEQTGKIYYAIQIPHGESLISHFDLNSFTRGLDSFPADQRPPQATFVHLSFDGMVTCAFFMLLVGAVFWLLYLKRRRVVPEKTWLLWVAAISGPAGFLAMELGWMVTEEGRQPWVVYGLVRTQDAVNPARWMTVSFLVFSCIYVLLGVTLIVLLLLLARRPKPPQQWSELIEDTSAEQESREEAQVL
jgi:cytochrome d ubiquinol oxidase subunit I